MNLRVFYLTRRGISDGYIISMCGGFGGGYYNLMFEFCFLPQLQVRQSSP